MDDIDRAQQYQADEIKRAIARTARGAGSLGAEICAWCEDKIPMPRRVAVPGCTLCIQCQSSKERLKAR